MTTPIDNPNLHAQWPRHSIPLSVSSIYVDDEMVLATWEGAMSYINHLAGCQVFEEPLDLAKADVYLYQRDECSHAMAWWRTEGKLITRASVTIPGPQCGNPNMGYAVHELLHAIGFAHDDDPGSLMNPYYHRDSAVTREDIELLQALYCDDCYN